MLNLLTMPAFVAVGSAAGGVLRYGLAGLVQRTSGGVFPIGTLVVNVVGCLLIGLSAGAFAGPHVIREEYRLALQVGVLGGFTTFSTFGLESFLLANDGQVRFAAFNLVLSNGLGLTAVWLGYRLAEKWLGA